SLYVVLIYNHSYLLPFPTRRSSDLRSSLRSVIWFSWHRHSCLSRFRRRLQTADRQECLSYLFPSAFALGRTVTGNANKLMKPSRSEEHTSELKSPDHIVCRLLL